jgi:formate dehydrogenase accessory protein FdhD
MPRPVYSAKRQVWRDGGASTGTRQIPEETALALTYNGGTYAVMMGTPHDLADFAVGFSLSEGIVRSPDEIETFDIVEVDDGIELRMWLTPSSAELVNERRRHIAGPTGCGICGVESIAEAIRPAAIVPKGRTFAPSDIMEAMAGIVPLQAINHVTRAVHAAAFWTPARGIVCLREDVGRHNALDKLAGARRNTSRRRHRAADQPRFGGNGAKDRGDGHARHGRGIGADRTGRAHGRCRRHNAGRHCTIRRFRSFHTSGTGCGLTEYWRCGGYPCRLIG